jgi:hypothetical protein
MGENFEGGANLNPTTFPFFVFLAGFNAIACKPEAGWHRGGSVCIFDRNPK